MGSENAVQGNGDRKGWLARAFAAAGPKKGLLALAMALAALSSAASFVPYVAMYLVVADVLSVYPDFGMLDAGRLALCGWLAVGGAVGNIVLYTAALLCSHSVGFDTAYRLRLALVESVSRMPLGRFSALGSGRVSKVMDASADKAGEFLAHSLPDLVASMMAPVILLALLFVFDWRFGAAALACAAAGYGVQMAGSANARMRDTMPRYMAAQEQMANATVEYVRGMPVVKAFGKTASSFSRLAESVRGYTGVAIEVALFWQNLMPVFTAIVNNAYLFVLPVGIIVASGVGDWAAFALNLIFYLLFVPSIAAVLNKLMYVSQDGANFAAHLDSIDEVLAIPGLAVPDVGARREPADASISFENVTFSYEPGGAPALRNVSFRVPSGTTCAIVGPSGAGKSTIASLVARFWDVDAGSVRIGGVDVRDMGADELMSHLGLVFQDVHLFKVSMLDNIRLARPGASREEAVEAARAAQADEFISSLPDGYDTVFGSEGVKLSGGEMQRVSIARAILADAPIVVLDEATAFADPENEHLIHEALGRLTEGKTVVMIAHRLSTVAGADQVVVVDDGRIAETGTHEELVSKGGAYARMWHQCERALSWGLAPSKEVG